MASPEGPSESRPVTREGLVRAGLVAWSIIGFLLLLFIALRLLYEIREIFPPLVLALAIIFLLNPLVSRLERLGVGRVIGTFTIYILFLTTVVLAGVALAPTMRAQFQELANRLPDLVETAFASAQRIAAELGLPLEEEEAAGFIEQLRQQAFVGFGRVTRFAGGALHLLLVVVLAPILALYLLIDLPRLSRSFVALMPDRYREEWLALLERCGQAVGGFFRGQLLVATLVGILSALGLWLAGIPFWLPIGAIAGFTNLIPLIGPWIGGALAVVVGAVEGGMFRAVLAGIVMIAVQQIDNHFISPYVMSRVLRMHPVTVILALIAGGTVAGLWGMLLAVPATAVAKILFMHYYSTRVLGTPLEAEFVSAEARSAKRAPEAREAVEGAGSVEREPSAAGEGATEGQRMLIADTAPELQEVLVGRSPSASATDESGSGRRPGGSSAKTSSQSGPQSPGAPPPGAKSRLTRPISGAMLRQFFRRLIGR